MFAAYFGKFYFKVDTYRFLLDEMFSLNLFLFYASIPEGKLNSKLPYENS